MSPKKCPRKVTQKGDISWTKLSTRCHQKCPRNVTSFVHEMSPIMSTKCLPPSELCSLNKTSHKSFSSPIDKIIPVSIALIPNASMKLLMTTLNICSCPLLGMGRMTWPKVMIYSWPLAKKIMLLWCWNFQVIKPNPNIGLGFRLKIYVLSIGQTKY